MVHPIDAVNQKTIDVHKAVDEPHFSATSYSAMALKNVNTGVYFGHDALESIVNQCTDC